MSGIALVLKQRGYTVSGCDSDCSQKSVVELLQLNCTISEGNNSHTCKDATIDVVVYSTAITQDNPELLSARQRGIPTIHRSVMLAELMRSTTCIAVAGSHGKTTTSSLIAHTAVTADLDPTVVVGGHITSINSNARAGRGTVMIAEADESDRSFLALAPTIAVITNIDYEHVETYHDLSDIIDAFSIFISRLPSDGKAIICLDDPHARSIIPSIHCPVITYGITTDADYTAHDIVYGDTTCQFTLVRKHYPETQLMAIPLLGNHNIENALATCAAADALSIPWHVTQMALARFAGVDRRFTFKGTFYGASFYDDYGHHPVEIRNTLAVARKKAKHKLIVIFQPHRYSRTEKLWDDFITVLVTSGIDTLIITDIFAASEIARAGITGERLALEIAQKAPFLTVKYASYDPQFTAIKSILLLQVSPEDTVLLLGAGKMNKLVEYL